MAFIRVAAMIYHIGGEVSVERPRYASGWSLPELIALIEQFALIDALCDGCAFGLEGKDKLPLLKPWRTVTSSKRLATNLSAYRCRHAPGFRHAPVEGSESRRSAFYPEPMARVIIASLFLFSQAFVAPALPCRPLMVKPLRSNAFVVRKMGLSMPVLGLNLRFSQRLMFSLGLGGHPIPFISVHSW